MKKAPPEYLTIAEIADALGCSDSHVYNTLLHQIPGAWKLGTRWRLTRTDLEAYIEEQRSAYAEKQAARQRRLNEPARVPRRKKPTPDAVEPSASTIRISRARHPSPLAEELRLSLLKAQDSRTVTSGIRPVKARHFSPLREQLRASLNAEPKRSGSPPGQRSSDVRGRSSGGSGAG